MNRIYQGRVSKLQILKNGEAQLLPNWEEALWKHHQLFQDAVNYYILALASMGISPGSKLTGLRSLLEAVWVRFEKKGRSRQGMSESLQRAWQLGEAPTIVESVARFREPLTKDGIAL